ncbi:hypothetical protein SAMN05216191_101226 [Paenibacillus jilunlii]|uniref:Uncharacterized protein n=1 Tax=Paenibacillus jilunlii TaxID=682956 RepID=A0A1G9G655_9BACL|nr:hypothetical protein SAMN05216191_101226 [Paenibacillus jilunlii]
MTRFEQQYAARMHSNIEAEKGPRRLELLEKGLGHGMVEFLRCVWFPVAGNFNDLFPEWEVRDFGNSYRYCLPFDHRRTQAMSAACGY